MLTVRVSRTAVIEVVTDVSGIPGLKVTKEMIKAETVLGESSAQAVIREHLFIPEVKPDVVSIIDQGSYDSGEFDHDSAQQGHSQRDDKP